MSYPVGWDLVNVTGNYIGKNGVPCVGSVTFSSPQLVLRSGTIVPAADIVFTLVNGAFSGQIPATDDPNANPVGWVYTVTENVPGGRQGYQIVAPHSGGTIDLSTVIPVTMPMPPTFGFPYVTSAQLSAPTGASMIGYQLTALDSVARTVQTRLSDEWHLKDFGAALDGVTDDTTAITNLLAAVSSAGRAVRVRFSGVCALASAITINQPILFVGDGVKVYAYNSIPAAYGSVFKYIGTTLSTPFITIQNINDGGLDGVGIDCNALAAEGLDVVAVTHGKFNLSCLNWTNWGVRFGYSTSTTNTVTAWNDIPHLYIDDQGHAPSGKCGLWLTQMVGGGSNACHNNFGVIHINHGGSCHGLYLGACDNNHINLIYTFRNTGGTGYGCYADPTEVANFPVNNTICHAELGAGWFQPSSTANLPARIDFYATDNGEPIPNLGVSGSWLLDCPNVTYSYAVTAATGFTGTVSSATCYYQRDGNRRSLVVEISGTSLSVAAGATITGLPSTSGDTQGAYALHGVVPQSGAVCSGYASGTTWTVVTAIGSFTGTLFIHGSMI